MRQTHLKENRAEFIEGQTLQLQINPTFAARNKQNQPRAGTQKPGKQKTYQQLLRKLVFTLTKLLPLHVTCEQLRRILGTQSKHLLSGAENFGRTIENLRSGQHNRPNPHSEVQIPGKHFHKQRNYQGTKKKREFFCV